MRSLNCKIKRSPMGTRWWLVTECGSVMCTSATPAGIRRKRRGYFLYSTRPDHELDGIFDRYFRGQK